MPGRSVASRFLAIEGPNGVGKSSVAKALAARVATRHPVLLTREPTDSPLGRAIRAMEAQLHGVALAYACAADRAHHVEHEIQSALAGGAVVITDRYVPSSLVLQRIDGVEPSVIWSLNASMLPPDLVVFLEDAPQTLAARLADRARTTRLEDASGPTRELAYYRDAQAKVAGEGWSTLVLDGAGRTPEALAERIERAAGLA